MENVRKAKHVIHAVLDVSAVTGTNCLHTLLNHSKTDVYYEYCTELVPQRAIRT